VVDWNNFFDTNTMASKPFSSVSVNGYKVTLNGAQNLTIRSGLFNNSNLISINDSSGMVTHVETTLFNILHTWNLLNFLSH
jgi:hypothetical protein